MKELNIIGRGRYIAQLIHEPDNVSVLKGRKYEIFHISVNTALPNYCIIEDEDVTNNYISLENFKILIEL